MSVNNGGDGGAKPGIPVKRCYRHLHSTADIQGGARLGALLQSTGLPQEDRISIQQIWQEFQRAAPQKRRVLLAGLLEQSCISQLSLAFSCLETLLRIDIVTYSPKEVAIKILSYLDAKSLCHAAQVSKKWYKLANNNLLWKRLCSQHIDRKCPKCGWGLPLLDYDNYRLNAQNRYFRMRKRARLVEDHGAEYNEMLLVGAECIALQQPPPLLKRPRFCITADSGSSSQPDGMWEGSGRDLQECSFEHHPQPQWKEIYRERLQIERNWRGGKYKLRTLRGHEDGILALQFDGRVIFSGSYDHTIKLWDFYSGQLIITLHGHEGAIKCLQVDHAKIVSGSLDGTVKVWKRSDAKCQVTIRHHVIPGIESGCSWVTCLGFNEKYLITGSNDCAVRIWKWATEPNAGEVVANADNPKLIVDAHNETINTIRIYQKTKLFTGSDDTIIKLWDLLNLHCIKKFIGHVGQVQCLSYVNLSNIFITKPFSGRSGLLKHHEHNVPLLVSGSLDHTIKVWLINNDEGKNWLATLFGHVEGIWSLDSDSLRIVSAAHDRTLRVWDLTTGKCMYSLNIHTAPVTCVILRDTNIISAGDDGLIVIWDYGV